MKTNVTPLYPNEAVAERVTAYSAAHTTALPAHIVERHAWVIKNHARSNYMISNFQAQCLVFIARLVGARRVLEIGVYAGYSTMVWAHAVGPEGKVTGLEFSEEYAKMAEDTFKDNGVSNVEIIRGDALKTLEEVDTTEPYDLIFIDAQKSGYPAYLKTILARSQPGAASRFLRPGGLIIADNVLRRALVADESADNPYSTGQKERTASEYEGNRDLEYLREFNDALVGSERLDTYLMPLYDGMGMGRLRD